MKNKPIPVIDLFAGPGGLGEGFSALTDSGRNRIFKIAISIEKDEYAHQTLELRSFFRQFEKNETPEEYYQYLRGELSRNDLFETYPEQSQKAKAEAFKIELGNPKFEKEIDERISEALGDAKKWMLIGGPPCQAYSLVGRSRRKQKDGLNEEDEKVYLYRSYYRILAAHNPPVFIMENVKGLLSSKLEGESKLLFSQILSDLRDPVAAYNKLNGSNGKHYSCPGYKIYSLTKKVKDFNSDTNQNFELRDYIVRCEDYGIPQSRHRVILLGIRKDWNVLPNVLRKVTKKNIEDAIADLPRLRSGLSKEQDSFENWKNILSNLLSNGYSQEIENNIYQDLQKIIATLSRPQKRRGGNFVPGLPKIKYQQRWFTDNKLKGFCNHSSRAHIVDDIYRYLFASTFAKKYKRSPKIVNMPVILRPDHENISEAISDNKFADRFRVQVKGKPSKTITSHISKDGHYYIHYDPSQCRSLTVREAARIQTFPDNYFFCGPRTSQYNQVGNAVPPLLAYKVAGIIKEIFENASYINI